MIRQHHPVSANPASSTDHAGTDPVVQSAQKTHELFRKFSQKTSAIVGTPWAFACAVAAIIIWAALGPMFHFSDTWQLVINTATTIVTFLMVFLIQNTQNRDARAIHLKLDELIRGNKRARNWLVDLENCTEEELEQVEKEFHRIKARAHKGEVRPEDARHVANLHEKVKTIADSPSRS
jgi:low affinity Fe/Cu permease